jgi:hypothetical protein
MEYIYVEFREQRRVLADGTECGDTNTTLRVQRATYTITLSGDPDYLPPSQEVTVANTSFEQPMRIKFT